MLRENKTKKTPEQAKKAKAAKIKAVALTLYPHYLMVANAQANNALKVALDTDNMEQARAIRKLASERAAELAIDSVEAFESVWKRKKGQWLNDDA